MGAIVSQPITDLIASIQGLTDPQTEVIELRERMEFIGELCDQFSNHSNHSNHSIDGFTLWRRVSQVAKST